MDTAILNFFRSLRQAPDKWMLLLFPVITLGLLLAILAGLWGASLLLMLA
ncbi:MAG: hypothetical protein VKJ06_04415 [Vampirovibrionales bacterium]|nr:hypothetical protein [Vampirovibrionales bacterium]